MAGSDFTPSSVSAREVPAVGPNPLPVVRAVPACSMPLLVLAVGKAAAMGPPWGCCGG